MFAAGVVSVEEVQGHVDVLGGLVGRLEPGAVPVAEAAPMWQAFDAMERLASGAKTLLAARVDESGVARQAGAKTTAEYLARRSGTTPAAARSALETSKRLRRLAHTSQAVRRGELSPRQAEEIADAADKNPASEQRLLDTAKRSSLGELRQECARRRAEADPDAEATRRRLHRARWLRRWTDREGAWNLQARGTPEDGSRFNAVLDRVRDELFHQARRQGRHEPAEAYAFDALITLANRHGTRHRSPGCAGGAGDGMASSAEGGPGRDVAPAAAPPASPNGTGPSASPNGTGRPGSPNGTGGPGSVGGPSRSSAAGRQLRLVDDPQPPGEVTPWSLPDSCGEVTRAGGRPVDPTHLALLRVDWQALVRGSVREGEVCEVAGVGPVSVTAARALLGESVLRLVITKGVDVVNVTNLGRGPRAAQKVALLWTQPGCAVLGCNRRLGIEHDHRDPWAAVHETATGNIDKLCDHHHRLKTHDGWALVPGTGKRPMVPPDHPDHPNRQRGSPGTDRSPPTPKGGRG